MDNDYNTTDTPRYYCDELKGISDSPSFMNTHLSLFIYKAIKFVDDYIERRDKPYDRYIQHFSYRIDTKYENNNWKVTIHIDQNTTDGEKHKYVRICSISDTFSNRFGRVFNNLSNPNNVLTVNYTNKKAYKYLYKKFKWKSPNLPKVPRSRGKIIPLTIFWKYDKVVYSNYVHLKQCGYEKSVTRFRYIHLEYDAGVLSTIVDTKHNGVIASYADVTPDHNNLKKCFIEALKL